MAFEYKYDESSETWPYFVLALLVFFMVPITVRWLIRALTPATTSKPVEGAIPYNHITLELPNAEKIEKISAKKRSGSVFNRSFVLVVLGWAAVAYMWITYAKVVSLAGYFDPYTILDIPYTSSEKEIKSRYRKLSLQYHPDKIAKDLTDKVKEEMEAAFIQINLAYKALTDETTKCNLELYGHPDGQQEVTHGVAIPKFLVEGRYSQLMIIFYFILIGVVLPFVVGSWWNNVKATTKRGLLVDSAASFVRHLADKNPAMVFTPYTILDWVLECAEITHLRGDLSVEEVKALVLRYLKRESTGTQEELTLKIVSELLPLISGFIEIATAFKVPDVILPAYELQKALHQACSPMGKHKELLQLPYVDSTVIEAQSVKKLGKLLTLSEEEAGKVLGITDSKKLKIALDVAKKIPFIRVLDASFKVSGEDAIYPNSSTHIVVKFLIKSAALKSCPEIPELRFDEEETIEDLRNPVRSNGEAPPLPPAYAPYFPGVVANAWEGYIMNQSDIKFIEGTETARLTNVELTNMKLSQKEWSEGNEYVVALSTFKLRLPAPAPPAVGDYSFRLIFKNNAYFGTDVDIPVDMKVDPIPANVEAVKATGDAESDSDSDSDLDISDPEEDSIAGALAGLRGQSVKKSSNQEDSGEWDTESVFTDINTDTEDEGDDA
ncbi:hypothetical protein METBISCDRAFT_27227 [Metschnikowia bicuspidata]|uniref:J domain-containing protein n=1 Tax=Metschnikowia bicuspidata TaxID=27322 RepID=A0A4P9ZD50_9ASCO|nr:hypothetical protein METBISCDRAFT_27227 [Metschnikowia bicuspidata]